MPNLKIVSDNAARRATVSATSSAGNLTPDRLKLPIKTRVWRSVGTSATLTVVLPTAEPLDCVALPFCNLSSSSTIRVKGYATSASTTPLFDTGIQPACPYLPFDQLDWGAEPLGVNAFSYGGASQSAVWFDLQQVQKIEIILDDPLNAAGYLEAACLVVGLSWSPRFNMGYGAGVVIKESTKNERTQSGNLKSDRGTLSRSLSMETKYLEPVDRNKVWNIMLTNGMSNPAFFSLYPDSTDVMEEQMHQVYGKLTQQSKLSVQSFGMTQATFEVEEI